VVRLKRCASGGEKRLSSPGAAARLRETATRL
jgi:hypothetical protein